MARMREAFGLELPLRGLFEGPTVAELGEQVEAARLDGAGLKVPALVGRPRPDQMPLSFAQERLWLLEQLGAAGAAYTIAAGVRLEGGLDVVALDRAFCELVKRHETLRTRFTAVEGTPVQVIEPGRLLRLEVGDLSGLAEDERLAAVRRRSGEMAREPFDLEHGPLFRASLFKLSAEEHVVVVVMHHIISDGWSLGVLIREVGALYGALVAGGRSPLAELSVQYADYTLWQREWLQGEVLEQQVAYWKERLAGAPAALDLPTDRMRPAVQSFRGTGYGFTLSPEIADALARLARSEGATLFMVLLAALQTTLSRWSGQDDIVVGTPIAGRTHRQTEGLIGFFVNMLALRTDLSGDPSFRELLRRVKEVTLEAYAHQDLPFEKLVEVLRPVRDLSRQPIFQVLLALQNVPQERLELPGLRLSRVGGEHVTARFDLSLYVQETEQGLRGHFEYATELFDGSTIERLAGHFERLLGGVMAAPDCRLSELGLLSDAERLLTAEWNATAAAYPQDKCVHELIAEQAARKPEAVAVVYEDRQLSYTELERRSNQLAHYLKSLGVGPEVIVGLCVERSLEMVVGLLGILKAGGAYLPLDASYPRERLAYMLEDAGVAVLVTQAGLAAALPAHDAVVRLDADWPIIANEPTQALAGGVGSNNLAYVIYTSGSTGKPKGVMVGHGAVVNFLCSMAAWPGLGIFDVLASVTPLSFDIAGLEIYLPLVTGARLVVIPRSVALDGRCLHQQLEAVAASVMQATPASWRLLGEAGWRGKGLKVLCGGEALPADLARVLPAGGGEVWNLYGPTETTIWSTAGRVVRDRPVTIGRPIRNTQAHVLDRWLQPVPIGVAGELSIGGHGLARGYLDRAGATAERFIPDPFGDGERLYRTGDLARWRSEGELECLGRIDHQIKVRGHRIEPGEIEAVLTEHSSVRQAVIVAGEEHRLVAYVVGADEARPPDPGVLRTHVKQSLPEHMVPSAFVTLAALPLTANGKVDRRALPAPNGRPETAAYVAPRTPTEEVLAGIWGEVLKVERVGVADNFFELGGHSLLATRVMARMREAFGLELPLRGLFESQSITDFADRIDTIRWAALRSGADPVPTHSRQEEVEGTI
jgi:amino acid adenylation domain-containing protein